MKPAAPERTGEELDDDWPAVLLRTPGHMRRPKQLQPETLRYNLLMNRPDALRAGTGCTGVLGLRLMMLFAAGLSLLGAPSDPELILQTGYFGTVSVISFRSEERRVGKEWRSLWA